MRILDGSLSKGEFYLEVVLVVPDCECRIIKKIYCHPIGATFEAHGASPDTLVNGFKNAFGEKPSTVHMTIDTTDGQKHPLGLQIVEISHADNSGCLIDFKANVDPADGFGHVICGRCDGKTGKSCISIESI